MPDGQTPLQGTCEPVSFEAGDKPLAGYLFRPAGMPRAALVLNGATGVPQKFYRHFAAWLADEQGIACLTYDYSDFAESARGSLRKSDATMAGWALTDQPAARAEMLRHYPDVPLWVLGHSLGGMLMPSQQGIEQVDRMICVCSGLVHHGDHPWPYQGLARMFWFGHVPLLVSATGYLPGRLIGFGADLPSGVYWQWRKWCTHRESYLPEVRSGAIPAPDWSRSMAQADFIALSDDQTIPPLCVNRLADLYSSPRESRTVLSPSEHGLGTVGHLAAFARHNAALWPELIRERSAV